MLPRDSIKIGELYRNKKTQGVYRVIDLIDSKIDGMWFVSVLYRPSLSDPRTPDYKRHCSRTTFDFRNKFEEM